MTGGISVQRCHAPELGHGPANSPSAIAPPAGRCSRNDRVHRFAPRTSAQTVESVPTRRVRGAQ